MQTVQADDIDARTVSASGQASISAEPDFAMVNMAIASRSPSIETARKLVNERMAAFLEFASNLGIAEKHIDTTGVNIEPVYEQRRQMEQPRITGYNVQRRIAVRVEKLEQLGELLEGAVSVGINSVAAPVLDTEKRGDLHRQALKLATLDARRNAEAAISGLDQRLGPVRSVNVSTDRGSPGGYQAYARSAMMAEAADTYQAGEMTISARVTATFDIIVD
jgi:uncharacterized protein YggE